jgi:hypothetical protein
VAALAWLSPSGKNALMAPIASAIESLLVRLLLI